MEDNKRSAPFSTRHDVFQCFVVSPSHSKLPVNPHTGGFSFGHFVGHIKLFGKYTDKNNKGTLLPFLI